MRAPYQILVFPYFKKSNGQIMYALFKRRDLNVWQGIAGGGEQRESPMETAKREAFEEAGISAGNKFFQLSSIASIPVEAISGFIWGKNTLVIPEYSFGVEVHMKNFDLKEEHTSCEWLSYERAQEKLNWESNKIALQELHDQLTKNV